MALRHKSGGDDKRTLKIGLAVGLLVVAGVVFAWQFMRDGGTTRVSDEVAKKADEAQQALKDASKNPPVPDTAPKPAGPVKKSEGRGPTAPPK